MIGWETSMDWKSVRRVQGDADSIYEEEPVLPTSVVEKQMIFARRL